jgi:hypothetical protein
VADDFSFADDDKKAASPPPKAGFSWDAEDPTHAAAAARVAQPTEFEKASAARGDSATPGLDTLKGFGEGALKTAADVGWGISKIPGVGKYLVPAQGLAAENKLATPRTPGEKLGSNIEGVAEAAVPVGEAFQAAKGSKYIRPIAQYASENILPAIKGIPYIGRGIEAAETAPTLTKALVRAGARGAGLGAVEGAWQGRGDPYAIGRGAAYGGLGGALAGAGAYGINKLAGGIPEVASAFKPQGPQLPPELAGPGGIPVVGSEPLTLRNPDAGRETAVQPRFEFPGMEGASETATPAKTGGGSALNKLEGLVEEAAGTKPLQPAVSLRNQLPQPLGAGAGGFPAVGDVPANMGGKVTFRREPIAKTVPGLEEGPLRAQPPEGLPTVATEEPARQMGAPPLQPAVSLREQFKPTGMEPASKQLTLEQKYPDREVRQLVHANGEDMVDAAGNDRETLKAIHDLKNTDVRQALINSGEDMGQTSIGNRKATGDQMTRQDAFKKLLAKGYTPQQIVDLAKQETSAVAGGKPGPMRATGERPAREKAGD